LEQAPWVRLGGSLKIAILRSLGIQILLKFNVNINPELPILLYQSCLGGLVLSQSPALTILASNTLMTYCVIVRLNCPRASRYLPSLVKRTFAMLEP